ncbi:hypothetical protein VW23_019785 [Devosia insulae DS-56]|uniref:histidine kinase n=1 Tax=Devosia insulae DS-56 TaxID=1116389 RepID=A0A1E5XQ28_9HYPH|nr:ATP-binding protein [Devosia insulae]OEO30712.1 hypothetical protein VW23_019785 [Devosia insulae DS-56]
MKPTVQLNDADVRSFGLREMGLVHDLRNLLQIISSAVQLIEREADRNNPAAVHRLAQSAQASVERATALSREIAGVSRSPDRSRELVDVATILGAMRDLISLTVGPSVRVDIYSSDGIPHVRCDGRHLENALLNLVANARDAMPGGGELRISLFLDEDSVNLATGGYEVALKIDDTGHGMSRDLLRQVLTPFFTTKPADRGTGLGLSIVRDFADSCGGSVAIESILGEGTSVLLRLPSHLE